MSNRRAQGKMRREDLVSYEYALRLRTKLVIILARVAVQTTIIR
jgi:hypothetical protein